MSLRAPVLVGGAALLALTLSACAGDAAAETPPPPEGVAHEYATMAEEIAAEGGQTTRGPWRIGYIVEDAEPWYETHEGHQVFREVAAGETHHIEILPFEAETGRLVPATAVTVEVLDASGTVVDEQALQLLYGEFFHYAANFSVPEPGTYALRATVDAPTFARHGGPGETPPLTEGTTVTFKGVELG